MNSRTLLLPLLLLASCSHEPVAPPPSYAAICQESARTGGKAVPIELSGVDNMYCISRDFFRSGQPDAAGFRQIQGLGVRSVLNLRDFHKDDRKASGTQLRLFHHKMSAGSITEADIEQCLLVLRHAPKPVLVHCLHGSDRTGTIVASYRIVEQGWNVEDAIAEMKEGRFGYHSSLFPYIPDMLRSIDWRAMRKRLDATAPAKSR